MKLLNFIAPALTAASVAALLAACGDDSSNSGNSNNSSEKVPEYETAEDMVHCTKSHYGEFAYVVDEDAYYECTSDGWVVADSSDVEDAKNSSSSEKTEPGEISSSSIKTDEKDTVAVEVQKVDSAKISGFAQKGPFVNGSSITVYGLDDALEATSEKFTGKVSGDSGFFNVEGITLKSQYALVEAYGFYKNAVLGKNTSGSKTKLRAIVDLSEKDVKANVNILTELEYARVKQLVTKEKFNVPAAKVRATKELLGIFGASFDGDISATDLSLTDTGKVAVALYAASIALQGDLSASKLNSRLEDLSEDFALDGSWDNAKIRAEVADFLSMVDSASGFAAIRDNIANMKLSASVPDYESVLYSFWTGNFDLGTCTDDKETTIVKNKNKESSLYGAGYVCANKRWHKSTALDAEIGLCLTNREGNLAKDTSGKAVKYYVCESGAWRNISDVDYELNVCKENRLGEVTAVKDGASYICRRNEWQKASDEEIEMGFGCVDSLQGKIKKTSKDNYFLCNEGEWIASSQVIAELGECTEGEAQEGKKGIVATLYYICEAKGWKQITYAEYEFGYCTDDRLDEYNSGFVCSADGWREASTAEMATEKVCNESTDSTFVNGYACVESAWRVATAGEKANNKFCTAANDSTISNKYVCLKGEWKNASAGEIATEKMCASSLKDTVLAGYACKYTSSTSSYAWNSATAMEKIGKAVCRTEIKDQIRGDTLSTSSTVVCDGTSWRYATAGEVANKKLCTSKISMYSVSNGYVCENSSWRKATDAEIATDTVCRSSISSLVINGFACVYASGVYSWRAATAGEIGAGAVCRTLYAVRNNYICVPSGSGYDWRVATAGEVATGAVCAESIVNTAKNNYACVYSSGEYKWRQASTGENSTGYVCSSERDSTVIGNYVCKSGSWYAASVGEAATGKICNAKRSYEATGKFHTNEDTTAVYRCTKNSAGDYVWEDEGIEGQMSDSRDAYETRSYTWHAIGGLVWMDRNMNYSTSGKATITSSDSSMCYGGKSSNCSTYGRLYSYKQAQSACPNVWHPATKGEWNALVKYIERVKGPYYYYVARDLRAKGGWPSSMSGFDTYGFKALPGGFFVEKSYAYDGCTDRNVSVGLGRRVVYFGGVHISGEDDYGDDVRFGSLYFDCESNGKSVAASEYYTYVRCVRDYFTYGSDK